MAKKKFDLSEQIDKKSKPVSKLNVLTNTEEIKPLERFKNNLQETLIENLKIIYKSEKWKYRLIKNAKERYNIGIQYSQLNNFERGGSYSSNIISLILLEVSTAKKEVTIMMDKENVKIKYSFD